MKKLHGASLILFNIFAMIFGLSMLFSALCKDAEIENALSTFVFGTGYTKTTFTGKEPVYYKSWYQNINDLMEGSEDFAEAAEAEGAVLLKNGIDKSGRKALPLNKSTDKVSLFGVTAYDTIYSLRGAGTIMLNDDRKQFFKDEFENVGLTVNNELAAWYNGAGTSFKRTHMSSNGQISTLNGTDWDDIATPAKTASGYKTAIYITGRIGNEHIDLPPHTTAGNSGLTDGDYLKLSAKEKGLLEGLKAQKESGVFDRIIVLFNTAVPLLDDIIDNPAYGIDAALWIGHPGTVGIGAVAQLLVGTSTPSGKLSTTWFATRQDNPSANYFGDFSNNGQKYVLYQEGVYMGYRYSETRYEDYVMNTPLAGTYNYGSSVNYPFGFGQSYTEFSHEFVSLEKDTSPEKNFDLDGKLKPADQRRSTGDDYIVKVKVKNTGAFSGKEVVQIYLQQPYTATNVAHKVEKPAVELVGFAKTKKLTPGESAEVEIKIDANKYFSAYDIKENKYILDTGTYFLTAATDAHNAVNNILAAKDKAAAGRMTGTGNASLVKTETVDAARSSSFKYWTQGGATVKNLFDHADPNKADPDGAPVTFMSRSNWQGTVFSSHQAVVQTSKRLAGKALDDNGDWVNSKTNYPGYKNEYPVYGKQLDKHLNLADMIGVEYQDSRGATAADKQKWEDFLDQLTWDETVKLVASGRRRTESIDSIAKPFTNDINASNGINFKFNMKLSDSNQNGETGFSARFDKENRNYYPTGYPCETIIASTFNTEIALAVGQSIGEDALWSGCNGLYGFGLNMLRSPYLGRASEYYSEDSFISGVMAGWSSKGAQSKGLYVYNKHFVLNDQETNRNSYCTWLTEQTLRQIYLRPFEISIEIGDSMNVMSAFNRIGSIWSGNDHNLMTKCLRGELGMRGFAVSDWYPQGDGMAMRNGMLAGNDLPDGDAKKIYEGYGPGSGNGHLGQAMRVAAQRILYTVANSNAMNFFGEGTIVTTYEPRWFAIRDGIIVAVTVLFVASAIFLGTTVALRIVEKRKNKQNKTAA